MFNDVMRIMGSVDDVSYLLINDPMTRDLVIRRLFTDNNKALTDEKELVDSHEIEVSPVDVSRILAWVADHTSHFLLSTGRELTTVMTKYKDQLPKGSQEDETNPSSEVSKTGSNGSTS